MATEPPKRKLRIPEDELKYRDTHDKLEYKLYYGTVAEYAAARAAMLQLLDQADLSLLYSALINIKHAIVLDEDCGTSFHNWTPETFSRMRSRLETGKTSLIKAMAYYEDLQPEVQWFNHLVDQYRFKLTRLHRLENVVQRSTVEKSMAKYEATYQKVTTLSFFPENSGIFFTSKNLSLTSIAGMRTPPRRNQPSSPPPHIRLHAECHTPRPQRRRVL